MTYRAALVLKVVFLLVCCAHLASSQSLTVNKDQQTVGGKPIDFSRMAVGVPIQYVITISSSGSTQSPNVTVTDTPPANFVATNLACAAANNAGCPPPAMMPVVPFTTSPVIIPGFNIPLGGTVTLTITGYFTTPNSLANPSYTNQVTALRSDETTVESTAHASKNITVPDNPLPVDIEVQKTVTPATGAVQVGTTTGTTYRYTITIKENGPDNVYMGGFSLTDLLTLQSGAFLNYTIPSHSFSCIGSPCPTLPSTTLSSSLSSAAPAFQLHWPLTSQFVAGSTVTLQFDVVFSSAAICGSATSIVQNRAFLGLGSAVTSISDIVPANNTASVPVTSSYSLPTCPTLSAPVTMVKTQITPNPVAWGAPVQYQITIQNISGGPLANLTVSDTLQPGTVPAMTANLTSCTTTGTATCTPTGVQPVTIAGNTLFFTVSSFSLTARGQGSRIVIDFTVQFDAPCDMDPSLNLLSGTNRAEVAVSNSNFFSTVPTTFNPLPDCGLTANKRVLSGNPMVLGQPTTFRIVYQNPSAFNVWVATLLDSLSLSPAGTNYGNLPFTYGASSCLATSGTVTPVPGFPSAGTAGVIKLNSPAWNGLQALSAGPLRFSPGATLTCTLVITPAQPTGCQGAGTPQLLNSALMSTTVFNPNSAAPPPAFSSVAADLPLCRNVSVQKDTPVPSSIGPGGTVTYTIRVINNNHNDPVLGFLLHDPLPAGFTFVSSNCAPAAACNPTPPQFVGGNNEVLATIPAIPAGGEVDIQIVVQAPSTGGSYENTATGEFPQSGNFFAGGGVLTNNANLQVLTPRLTKAFSPATVPQGGNSTLTFTITNVNSDPAQSGINFVDTLPPGLAFAATAAVVNCGGPLKPNIAATVSGNSLTVSGGLGPRVHVCTVTVPVTVSGCGSLTNDSTNISQTANIDPTGANATLHVQGECGPSLTIDKAVTGVPAGYTGTFVFNVLCATPHGPLQQQVSITLPDTSVVVPGVTAGSSCVVEEGPPPALPSGFAWDSLPQYSPANGVIQIGAGANHVTVTNTAHPCNDNGQITITKRLVGVPPNFTGTFNFNIACTSPTGLVTQQTQITFPGTGTVTVTGLPAGAICTVSETSLAPLPAPLQWQPPVMTPPFGEVSLVGNCCATVEVVNTAKYCCGNPKKPGDPVDSNPGLPGTNRSAPRKKP